METIIQQLEETIGSSDKIYDMDRIRDAIQLAIDAHNGQLRRSGEEYVCHPLHVALILVEIGMDSDAVVAALLHDVVEDTAYTFDFLLEEGFPVHIVDALRCLTKLSEEEPYESFIQRVKTNPLAIAVKINDLTDNMDIRRLQDITDSDVKRLRKYLRAYQELTSQQ